MSQNLDKYGFEDLDKYGFEEEQESQEPTVIDEIGQNLSEIGSGIVEGAGSVLETGEDYLKSVGKGASLGFSDELAGGVGALIDMISGAEDRSFEGLVKAYKEARDYARRDQAKSEERSPIASTAGEITGAVASGIASGGSAPAGATLGARALQTAKLGAGMGAAEAAGRSEDLFSKQGLSDVAKGALVGTAAGAGGELLATGVGKGAKMGAEKLKELAKKADTDTFKAIRKAYSLGKEGYDLAPKTQAGAVLDELDEVQDTFLTKATADADDLTRRITETDKMLGKKMGDIVDQYEGNLALDETYEQLVDEWENAFKVNELIKGDRRSKLIDQVLYGIKEASEQGTLTGRQLKGFQKQLSNLVDDASQVGKQNNELVVQAQKAANEIDDIFSQIDGYDEAKALFREFRENVPENIIKPNVDPAIIKNFKRYGDLGKQKEEVLSDNVRRMIERFTADTKDQTAKTGVTKLLKYMKEAPEEVLETMGVSNYKQLLGEIEDKALQAQARMQATRSSAFMPSRTSGKGVIMEEGIGQAGRQQMTGLANRLGLARQAAKEAGQEGLEQTNKSLFGRSMEELGSLGDRFMQLPGAKQLGERMKQAAAQGDRAKMNAALFVAMQNPDTRALLQGMTPLVDADEE